MELICNKYGIKWNGILSFNNMWALSPNFEKGEFRFSNVQDYAKIYTEVSLLTEFSKIK